MAAYTLGNAPCLQCNSLFRKHLGPIPALLATTLPPTNANDSLDNIPCFRIKLESSIDNFIMFTTRDTRCKHGTYSSHKIPSHHVHTSIDNREKIKGEF